MLTNRYFLAFAALSAFQWSSKNSTTTGRYSLRFDIYTLYPCVMKHPPEALRSARLFDSGCGYLVVSRFKADGCVETGFFLLDVFCLGVKDAGFHRFSSVADYQESLLDRPSATSSRCE